MKNRTWLITVAFVCTFGSNNAYSENLQLILNFGGAPGEKLPYAYDYGLPEDVADSYTMRIPINNKDISAVFYDTLLTITAPDKIVRRVEASRAFKSLKDCDAALAAIEEKLIVGLPKPYTGQAGPWTYQSADGKAAGAITCTKASKRPFVVLRLEIAEPN